MPAMALAALDATVVATAVPQIVGDLGGFSVSSWLFSGFSRLFSGYLLAVTVTLPVYGKLSDTFGRKPVLAARLDGASDLDSVTRGLDGGTAPEATRRAIADAVHAVCLGAACAAALAFLVLLCVAPRRFPVLKNAEDRGSGQGAPTGC